MNTTEILSCFLLDSKPVSCEPYGNGHINSTFLVTTGKGSRYILQRLNEEAFKDVPALMENISGIAQFLDAKAKETEGLSPSAFPDRLLICLRTFLSKTSKQYEFKDLDESKRY